MLCLLLWPAISWTQQCDGQEGPLLDTPVPVTGVNSSNPEVHCFYFSFDTDITGLPTGITMDLWHQYEGDLGIWIEACGERLNVMQRPGALNNCDADCAFDQDNGDCGSSEMIGTEEAPEIVTFYDTGTDPEGGVSLGGNFGLTLDDGCGVSTLGVNSFTELWSNCPDGLVEAEICFSDHATLHYGYVSNLNFIFPNPYICGCMDPNAINYNPDASVSNGDCYYECPELDLTILNSDTTLCAGGATFTLSAIAPLAEAPTFEWFGSDLGTDYLTNLEGSTTEVQLPADFVGNITYTCVVTNAYNCQETRTVNVTVLPAPSVEIIGATDLCAGDSTLLSLSGGPYVSILWNTGATTESLFTDPGTYSVTVSTGGPCTATDSITVTAFPLPLPTITGQDTICAGDSTLLTATSGFVSYLWSTGDTLSTIMVQDAQTYTVTVTDANGCSAMADFQLSHYPNTPLVINGPTTFCSGDTLMLNATLGFASYLWSNGDTLPTIRVVQADTLLLMAVDSNGCSAQASFIVEELPLPTPTIIGSAFLCPGESVSLTSDTGYASYLWSTGSTDSLIVTDTAGVFTLSVQDSLGCSADAMFMVSVAPEPSPVILGDTLFCLGDSILLSVAPGFASYQWSNGAIGNTTYFSETGTQSVTVTNGQGCIGTAAIVLGNYPQVLLVIDGPTEICTGSQAVLQAPAGFTNYVWSDGTTGPVLTTGEAGLYTLSATAANGCNVVGSFTLNLRPEPTVAISGENEICVDGSTVLTVTPGFASYLWSDNTNGSTITATEAQVYSITVTDDLGCTAVASQMVTLSEPEVTITGDDRFCAGENTSLTATGGFATYLWSTDEEVTSITTNEAGVYGLTVTNDLGCTATDSLTVSVDPLPEPTISGNLEFCTGTSLTLTAGAGYATYEWSIASSQTSSLVIDTAGTYGLTVTDNNGCVGATSATVTTLVAPTPAIIGDLAFCPGDSTELSSDASYPTYLWSNGATSISTFSNSATQLTLTVTDENGCTGSTTENTAPYPTTAPQIDGELAFCNGSLTSLSINPDYVTYLWSNGETTADANFNTSGPVSVTVTDSNGCTTNGTVDLSLFPEENLEILAPEGFCTGASATLSASGNFVNYLWSTDETSPDIIVSTAEAISLTATDENGCTATATTDLSLYPLPEPEIIGGLTFCPGWSTELTTSEPYATYQWSNQQDSSTVEISTPGTLGLTVTDSNGCSGTTEVEVGTAAGLNPELNDVPGICPDESTVLFVTEPYATYSWSDGSSADSLVVATPGTYTVSVTDQAGCAGTVSVEVTGLTAPVVELLGAEDFCAGTSITLTANTPEGDIVWNDGSTELTLEVNTGGEYGFSFMANNGCQASASTTVAELNLPQVNIDGLRDFCAGDATELSATPGFANYSWSTGATTDAVTIATPGPVAVTVTDGAGCVNTSATELNEIALPIAVAGTPQTLDCDTEVVQLGSTETTQGGVTYWWSGPGITSANLNELRPEVSEEGVYTLQASNDEFGCMSDVDSVEVTNLVYTPEVEIALLGILDCTTSSVIIDATGSATGTQYVYQWFDSEGTSIEGENGSELETDQAGMYTLLVTDTLTACFATEEITVNDNANYPPVTAGADQLLNCEVTVVTLNGSVDASGNAIVQEWTSTEGIIIGDPTDFIITTSTPGWYYLTATDEENGCTSVDSVLVNQDIEAPLAENSGNAVLDCNDESATLTGQGSSQGPAFNYQWWLEGTPLAGATTLSLTTDTPGQYELVVTNNENFCTASTAVTLSVDPDAPQEIVLEFDPPTCAGDQDGSVWVSQVSGGMTPYVYSFNNQGFTSTSIYASLGAGAYEVVVEDANGCQLSGTVELPDGNELSVELGENQTVGVGEPFNLRPWLSIDSLELLSSDWNTSLNVELTCPTCFYQYDIKIRESTPFFLTVTDENGCTAEDQVTIFVEKDEDIYLPTGFSPNGDGNNDEFYIHTDGQTIEKVNLMQIFNRWGELVWQKSNFQPDNPTLGWDGRVRGQEPNPAVYAWYAELELTSGEIIVIKGDVTLVN